MSISSMQTLSGVRLRVGKPGLPAPGRILVLSERLPIRLTRDGGAGWRAAPVRSALASALAPVLRRRRGVWIGCPDVAEEEVPGMRKVLAGAIQEGGYTLRPVALSAQEKHDACAGFSGEVLWPLFHDMPQECRFERAYWQAYGKVCRKFARAAARTLARSAGRDLLWVQDPLLIGVARELRHLGAHLGVNSGAMARTAFFLHLPFPAPGLFLKLPWRDRLLAGMLAYDQVGFQTPGDLESFLTCVRLLQPDVQVAPRGNGLWTLGSTGTGSTTAGSFPIGIDARDLAERAARPEVDERAARIRASHRGRQLVLGVDRLDRSRGILEKLQAFAEMLSRFPGMREKVSLFQAVTPCREDLPRHAALRAEIERAVGEVNGRFGRPGWVPVHYVHRGLEMDELLACYRAADVALVIPLKAGMELVAKEYCAADLDGRGVLVLSEFAGAAAQLADGALLVNPYNVEATARTLYRALRMKPAERAGRMRRLRAEVERHDVFWWAESFLTSALADDDMMRNSL